MQCDSTREQVCLHTTQDCLMRQYVLGQQVLIVRRVMRKSTG
jgi:hypothetical protein